MKSFRDNIILARPGHWIKNIVVLFPVIFGMQMGEPDAWAKALLGAVAFCFVSSFCYIVNDFVDRKSDREHPTKRNRPLASGKVTNKSAVWEAAVFLLLGLAGGWVVSVLFLIVLAVYAALQILYSVFLKHKVLLDVICIAMGFVLRAVAGAVAIKVAISPWLFICMFTICLFMGFCKRYNEIVMIGDIDRAENHRPTLIAYTSELLTHLITLSAGIAVMAFLMYGLNDSTIEQFGTNYFVYTLPLMIYAVFRFAMLSMKGAYSDPADLILHDVPFQLTAALWIACAIVIIKWGSQIAAFLKSA